MLIANPIYDVVFKKLMQNEKVAKFFISTILDQEIETVQIKPQEYTYDGEFEENDPKAIEIIEERIRKRYNIWVYRLDFIATIKTENGEYKKVLIEIQKARNQIDLMRFRNYLAEQYKKEDTINGTKMILPITTIYLLGFNIPKINSACIKVERNYKDLINNNIIDEKSDFIEKLTHDSYIIQVNRITNRFKSKLDQLLSIFEQANFDSDKKISKEYFHEVKNQDLKLITKILHHTGTTPKQRKEIEKEQEAWRTITALLEEKEQKILIELNETKKDLEQKNKDLEKKDKELEFLKKQLEELLKNKK